MAGTIQHQWNGTVLTITSDSGTSSCDLKGAKGDDGPRGAQGAPGSSVAEDSQKLGGVAAESYALKTDTIENANKLGNVAAAQYALKNNVPAHNLLDNSDFTNPVNQRNSAYYTNGNEYTIDRWKTQYGTNISIENGYVNIWGNWDLKQRLKKPLGIIYTLAAKVRINFTGDNTPAVGIDGGQKVELDAPIGEWRIYAKQIDISSITDETIEIQLAPNGGSSSGSISVEWVALYEGSYDASTLPAYQPKGYAAELAECQRYYRRFINSAPAISTAATAIEAEMPLEPPMRVVPTITINSVGPAYTPEGTKSLSGSYSATNTVNKAGYVFYTPSIGIGLPCVITGIDGYLSADL